MSTTSEPAPDSPALPAPPGQTSNPGPELDNQKIWIAANAVCLAIPSILVPLRLYIKAFIIKQCKWTDFVCLLAWLFFVALLALAFVMDDYGVGRHGWNVTISDFSKFAMFINLQQIVYMPAILFTKVAILMQFGDIFVTSWRNTRAKILIALIAANSVFFLILMFIEIFQCSPREKIWKPNVPGTCINIQKTFVATGVINVVDDLMILLLPISWVWKLKIATRRKFGICVIFATGIFACISSIMRLYESIQSVGNHDITSALLSVSLWAMSEVASGLVVCSLPVMPRLFKGWDLKLKSMYGSSRVATSIRSLTTFKTRNTSVSSEKPISDKSYQTSSTVGLHTTATSDDTNEEELPAAILKTVSIDQANEPIQRFH